LIGQVNLFSYNFPTWSPCYQHNTNSPSHSVPQAWRSEFWSRY
jgi:hypothetical protein